MKSRIILRPWAPALAEGKTGLAVFLFVLQVSIVFWPAAVLLAQELGEERRIKTLLDEISESYCL